MAAVAFRVDASERVGRGHLSRCEALAQELEDSGVQIRWICKAHKWVDERLGDPGSLRLAPDDGGLEEARTVAAHAHDCSWLVIDHYDADDHYVAEVRWRAPELRIATIDDHVVRRGGDLRFALSEPPASPLPTLAGLEYALLRRDFYLRRMRSPTPAMSGLLVSFGASDAESLTSRSLTALRSCGYPWPVTVIADERMAESQGIDAILSMLPAGSRRLANLSAADMAQAFTESGAALVSASTLALEALALGVRVVAIPWMDNQAPFAMQLSRYGVSVARDPEAAISMLTSSGGSQRTVLVDGYGACRAAAAMGFHASVDIPDELCGLPSAIRVATEADSADVWRLNNLVDARAASRQTAPITWDAHVRWWPRHHGLMLIAEIRGVAVAVAREEGGRIGLCVHRRVRRNGIAHQLLSALIDRTAGPMTAEIRIGNLASQQLFTKHGFVRSGACADADGFLLFSSPGRSRRSSDAN